MSSDQQQQSQQQSGGAATAQTAGLNPNAPAFVPNPRAAVFVPGQPYQFQHPPPMPPAQGGSGFYQQVPATQQQWMQTALPGQPQQQPFGGPFHGAPPNLAQQEVGGVNSHSVAAAPPESTPDGNFSSPMSISQLGAQCAFVAESSHPAQQFNAQRSKFSAWDDIDEAAVAVAPPPMSEQSLQSAKPVVTPSAPAKEAKRPSEPKAHTTPTSNVPGGSKGGSKRPVAEAEVAGEADADEATFISKFRSNVVVDENRKEHVNIVFIGHVDAGKSTIGGQLMYLTGMVDKRTLEKYEREAKEKGRESWYLSWALDTNDEEREKGKTVEVGRAFFETDKKHFTILDAPGHKSFVPNMIAGATQADLAVLVISARKGEFETGFDRGGQTREHAMLVKTAGVKHLVVLVNKMDDPTVGWSQERYAEIQEKLNPYLRKCGFARTDVKYIPCSGLTGAFLKERPEESLCSWYKDECFLEYIDTMLPKMSRDNNGPVRAIIADKYGDMGTVVIGKLESGVITKGQLAVVMPNRTPVQVLQCWTNDMETEQVYSGDNIKLKLKGVEESDVSTGFVVCSPEVPCKVGRIFDAEVIILEYKSIICAGYSCVLHIHAAAEEVSVKLIICTIDKKTGEKQKFPKFVRQDDKCIVRLESAEAFCLERFEDFPQMGRFTLRDEGKTIAIGKVLKVVE